MSPRSRSVIKLSFYRSISVVIIIFKYFNKAIRIFCIAVNPPVGPVFCNEITVLKIIDVNPLLAVRLFQE